MSFNYTNPYSSTRLPVFARNIVSTSHPLAAQAGLRMLYKGGNAVDAAVAMAEQICENGPIAVRACLRAIDEIVAPGVDLAPDEKFDTPPAILDASLRRR